MGEDKSESNVVSAPNQGDNSPGNLIKGEKCCDETDLRLNLDDLDDSGVNFDKDLKDRVIKRQDSDSMILELKAFIESGALPADKKRAKVIAHTRPLYQIIDGVLMHLDPHKTRELRLVVPNEMKSEILCAYHDDPFAGHQGLAVTYDRLRKSVYWDGMYTDVDKYIRSCDKCLRNKPGAVPNSHPMTLIPVSEHSFERVGTDLCGPFPQSEDGNKFVIAFVDYLSRWAITIAVPKASSETIAQHFIEKVVCIFSPPSVLLSDCGANFISQVLTEVCHMLKTPKMVTMSY
ncbi:MAG: transposase family protein, partial [Gammaproteobacteria bacterium]|nr:transposase family protein [Gammaproteobacteria bacterium]